jgi:hypothetical protein
MNEKSMQAEEPGHPRSSKIALGHQVMLGCLFFCICMGLGYPTLNRYDPRSVPGLFDTTGYYSLVAGGDVAGDESHRILVPYLAKPIYWLAAGHLNTWNPVFFALLVVNSFFIAMTAYLLVRISHRIVGDYPVALLSGFLYLVNFAVSNFNLSGYVDSAVNCMMIALVWALLTERWWLLPFLGILGALAKETFVPLAGVFVLAWWLTSRRRGSLKLSQLAWVGAMVGAGFATLVLLMANDPTPSTPVSFAAARFEKSGSGYFFLSGLVRCLIAREFLFVFAWLLPLGIWRLGRLPSTWVVGSACAAAAAFAMGAYDDAMGNTVRPLFSALGPLLSLSASILLAGACAPVTKVVNRSFN